MSRGQPHTAACYSSPTLTPLLSRKFVYPAHVVERDYPALVVGEGGVCIELASYGESGMGAMRHREKLKRGRTSSSVYSGNSSGASTSPFPIPPPPLQARCAGSLTTQQSARGRRHSTDDRCARHSSTRRASTPRRVCKVTRRRRRTRALTATVSRSDVDSHREALGWTLVIHYTVTPTLCLSFTTS